MGVRIGVLLYLCTLVTGTALAPLFQASNDKPMGVGWQCFRSLLCFPSYGGAAGAGSTASSFTCRQLESDTDGLHREAHPSTPLKENDSCCEAF